MADAADVRKVSHYRLIEKLGAGGMGEVYLAEDTILGRNVALKLLPQSAVTDREASHRLIREAQAAAQLDHPNICSIYEAGEEEGVSFIAMQLIEGRPLSDRVHEGTLSAGESLTIAAQVAEALGEAHRCGIVHRDVKPANVMIDRRGQSKLMDFGLAKSFVSWGDDAADDATARMLTRPGSVIGTVDYMSPEQLRGEAADARSDVWSFGVMLHELLTGTRPFSGKSHAEVISAILRDQPAPQAARGDAFGPVIDRCLRKSPSERYANAGEVHVALEILRKTPAADSPTGAKGSATTTPRAARSSAPSTGRKTRIGRIRSLAVLPLDSHSVDPEQEFFAEAMTESLLADLAHIGSLRVVSRTSVMRYKGTRKSLPQIARELNVDAIMVGSVLRVGGRVRISAQLIHGPTDAHIWSQSYERDSEDILALQSEVARAIADEVMVKLTPKERTRLSSVRRVDRAAHEVFLKGVYHFDRGDLGKGMELFAESTKLDPTYAPAWGRIARGYYYLGLFGVMAPVDAFSKLKDAAWKGQDLDPELADAYGYRAMASLYYDWNWAATGEEVRRALELKPNHSEMAHFYGHYLMVMGRAEEGLAACEHAIELDPLGTIMTACVGWHCLFSREIDDSIAPALRALELDPNLFWGHTILGWGYEQQGRRDESIAAYQKAIELSGGMVLTIAALGHAYAQFGRTEEAREVLAQLLERRKNSYVSAYDIATIHLALGDIDAAFGWLDEAYIEHASFLIHIHWDPRFDGVRDDPRFDALLRRIGLPSVAKSHPSNAIPAGAH
jgi:eukaryotic-like serine/threonine-protein kinase